ncbi:MAG: ACP S-malonyltransferase [Blastocatellia bacterium]
MAINLLLDHNIEGYAVYLAAGLKETGWDQLIQVEFKVLRDYGLPENYPDDEIWRFVQTQRLLLITNNRNSTGENSLQATMRRENTPNALPVLTIPNQDALKNSDYRQRAAHRLAEIILYLDNHLGTGRQFIP